MPRTARTGPSSPSTAVPCPTPCSNPNSSATRRGAFTDAKKDKVGRFAAAEGGTLFLDEIGDIPQSLQVKLLRVLQQKTYEPLGSNTPVKADVRIIAATNRDLPQLVREGQFRDDLYYRLNVVNIYLPPLRERIEDIPLLVEHFVKKFSAEKGKDIVGVSDQAIARLMRYSYHGNIRELENIIEYAFILCPGGYIQESHLPEHIGVRTSLEAPEPCGLTPGMTLEDIERQAIYQSLERNQWKKCSPAGNCGFPKTPCGGRSNITASIILPNHRKRKDSGQRPTGTRLGRGDRDERDTAYPAPASAGLAFRLRLYGYGLLLFLFPFGPFFPPGLHLRRGIAGHPQAARQGPVDNRIAIAPGLPRTAGDLVTTSELEQFLDPGD